MVSKKLMYSGDQGGIVTVNVIPSVVTEVINNNIENSEG